jgi:hypothetical protein
MKSLPRVVVAVIALVFVLGSAFAAEGWTEYKADEYGFTMQVPKGTQFTEKEGTGGWGELHATHEGVSVYALGKLGAPVDAKEIVAYGVKVTETAADKWKTIDKGADRNGWKWWESVEVTDGNTVVFGGYGVGPKGSYMMLMKTTATDFAAHKADYAKWYESIKLY